MSDLYAGSSFEAYTPSPFVLGGLVAFEGGTLASGQNLTKGTVIGRVTATGKLIQSVQTATDGSENPVGILNHDCDASAADTSCVFVKGGDIDKTQLTWDASWTATLQLSAFDRTPITLVTPE